MNVEMELGYFSKEVAVEMEMTTSTLRRSLSDCQNFVKWCRSERGMRR